MTDGRPDTARALLQEALLWIKYFAPPRGANPPYRYADDMHGLIARIDACLNPPSSSPDAPMPDSRSYEGDPRSPHFIPED